MTGTSARWRPPTGGIADLSQIPLDLVEKIEIIKGASSSVWGSSLGGVINIITRPVGKKGIPKVNGSMSFGEFRTQRERGEVSGTAGPLEYFAFGSYVDSGGFRPHSDVLEKRALIKGELPVMERVRLKGLFGYSGSNVSEFELNRLGIKNTRQVLQRYGGAGIIIQPADGFHWNTEYKISERSFRRSRGQLSTGMTRNLFRARSLVHEVSMRHVWDVDEHQTIVLGSDLGVDVYQDGRLNDGVVAFTFNKNNTRHAYYGNYQLSWWRFDVTTGSRVDAANGYGTNFDPSAGIVFHLPFWSSRLRGNVSRAFNAPSLQDRYLSSGNLIANTDLKAEYAFIYNLGVESKPMEKIRGKAIFFQTFLRDSIQTIRRSDGLNQPVNINKERRTGFETEVKLGPWWGFSPSYGTAFTYAVDQNDVPIRGRPRLSHDVKLNFHYELWGFAFNTHIAGRHLDLVTYEGGGTTDPIDQTFIFEGRSILTLPEVKPVKISLFLDGGNLLNQDFGFDGSNDPAPQRHFEAGFKISFDL
jgi:vitamin B12 transporter